MLQLILDLLKGITPLSGSAWTRLIFFIICIKNKSMKKKKNRWCEACLLLARSKNLWYVEREAVFGGLSTSFVTILGGLRNF